MREMDEMHPLRIAVIGAASSDDEEARAAEDTGRLIARVGAVFMSGGRGGGGCR